MEGNIVTGCGISFLRSTVLDVVRYLSTMQYGVLDEAQLFLDDPYLGSNLKSICEALLKLESTNATEIFGEPDDKKLKSSMTLFSRAADGDYVFDKVLEKLFSGEPDYRTLKILEI